MTSSDLLKYIDAGDFRHLFVEELGWSNPDRRPLTVTLDDGSDHTLNQVAGYKGLRVWLCEGLPDRRTQRKIDAVVGLDNHERLIVFANGSKQEWRWPRRARTSGANTSLMVHPHIVGETNPHLVERLRAVQLKYDEDPTLVELLARMRAAFDSQAETAAVRGSRLMGTLYKQLEDAKVDEGPATLLLARLLFLLFADDTGMWKSRPDLFKNYLAQHTSAAMLHTDLTGLFRALDDADKDKHLPADSPYRVFRYVNGGLFGDSLALPVLPPGFRGALLEACEFDWGTISPAVFGSMFQVVRDAEARSYQRGLTRPHRCHRRV